MKYSTNYSSLTMIKYCLIYLLLIFVFTCKETPIVSSQDEGALPDGTIISTIISDGETLENNVIIPKDTITAQIKYEGEVLPNIRIEFKVTEGPGFFHPSFTISDTAGLGKSIYSIFSGEIDISSDTTIMAVIQIGAGYDESSISVFVYDTLIFNLKNAGDPFTIEYFNFYPNNSSIVNLANEEKEISAIARDIAGVGVCTVPVRFRLKGENGSAPSGTLNHPFVNTCEDNASEDTEEGEGVDTGTYGIATVKYQNIGGGIDTLICEILDPANDTITLFSDSIRIETVGSTLLIDDVVQLAVNAATSIISITNLDSVKTDTIFAIALDNNNSIIPGIPFEFTLDELAVNSAYLSAGGAISDSSGIAYTILNVHPSIFSNLEDETVALQIHTSIPSTELFVNEQVQILNQLPIWYENSANLLLSSNTYTLPCDTCPNTTSATITASLLDSLLLPCPDGTVIEFSSIQKDTLDGEITWEQIGAIDPGAVFDGSGYAIADFSMGDDRGIAHIVGTVDNLSDTIQIVLQSTNASHIQIIPPAIDEIMVQGGGGTESSLIEVLIVDDYQNTVIDEDYQVHFQITGAPSGVTLDESGIQEVLKVSNFGTSNVTIVSGIAPGSVQLSVSLFDLNDEIETAEPIATAESIPLTVVTGPPEYGELNFSYLGIVADEVGAVYHIPLSVYLEDLHSNPVSDSTSIYFKIREVADTYNEALPYGYRDKVTWLSPLEESTTELDSIVYICINEQSGCAAGIDPLDETVWEASSYPAFIIGEGETGMPNSSGDSYPGIAYSEITYGSASIASEIIVFAQAYSTDNSQLIIDSRDTHNDNGIILPCYNCVISIFALPTIWDFSLPPFDPDSGPLEGGTNDFEDVTVQVTVTDHFQYYVNNALISLEAPQASFIFVCNGDDTDLDGTTGSCVNATNPFDVLPLVDSCWECADYNPDYIWITEDTDNNDPSDSDGTLLIIPDDLPNYARTNASGVALYIIRYSELVNLIDDSEEGVIKYEDFITQLFATLLTPNTNNATNDITITIKKTEED